VNRLWARVILAAIGLLAVLLIVEWLPGATPVAPPMQPPRIAAGARPGTRLVARETGQWVNAILSRPVFSISRRPPTVTASRDAGQVNGIPRLSGIMIAAGFKRAIFAPDGTTKPLVLGEGQSLADTSIRAIEPGEVILANGTELRPSYDKNRVTPSFTPPGLPGSFPNPAFQMPNFQGQSNAAEGNEPPAGPPFRGMVPPQRRERE
jgi:hypothetical protein